MTSKDATTGIGKKMAVHGGAASPLSTPTTNADYHALAAFAREELNSDNPPLDEGKLLDRLKWRCSQTRIDQSGGIPRREDSSPGLAHRVAVSEWYKHHHFKNRRRTG